MFLILNHLVKPMLESDGPMIFFNSEYFLSYSFFDIALMDFSHLKLFS
ncbi:hypothetical protein FLJC2902T_00770 [Flavobacterium limnosediminis JC2902]|uniref:Uncharacterized protein n=1 Tax=Flavobacterium limnosediminis JC2902 TaxID=1341181 RepID=V6STV2_9FLAO|nr:hypothetical protein FLJC2902T_00770 [Flavobacterium limnosediminis JC2902]